MHTQSDVTVVDVADDDVTVGELSRRLDRMEATDQRSFKALDDRMASSLVTRDYYDGRQQSMGERIKRLEDLEQRRQTRWFQAQLGIVIAILTALASLITVLVHVHG